ncbi:hypothetical protein [Vibrio harveyi]|uniref:hypothetical protein n=1 Tax=Vibrio harveyi TaxID=669 RepID=UPI003CF32382
MTGSQIQSRVGVNLTLPQSINVTELRSTVESFLDVASTSMGRETHYNSREEQELLERNAHNAMFNFNRLAYGALLTLPGSLERAQQVGIFRLLADKHDTDLCQIDGVEHLEDSLLLKMINGISVPRRLKAFVKLKEAKVNNGRARRIVLKSVLNQNAIEHHSVTYRTKLKKLLQHFVGVQKMGVVQSILSKPACQRECHENKFVKKQLEKYAPEVDKEVLHLAVAFIMGVENDHVLTTAKEKCPKIASYIEAKTDLAKGGLLTPEVLEGIRSNFHPLEPKERVLQLTASNMTDKGKMRAARRLEGVASVEDKSFDPAKLDAVDLIVYAFEQGMTSEISMALHEKAEKAAESFPVRYGKVGVVVDKSASMYGTDKQKMRPYAVALAMRDALAATGENRCVSYAGGTDELTGVSGDTSLSEALVETLMSEPDVVYVITDGYENAPAGRFDQTVQRIRELGIETPIYQLSPVSGAEAGGVRTMSASVPALPVTNSKALAMPFLKAMVQADTIEAVKQLIAYSVSKNEFLKLQSN